MNKKHELLSLSGLLVALAIISNPVMGAPAPGSMIEVNFMSQDPDPANAGRYVDLRWQAINYEKDPIDNLRFHLDVEYPLLFEAGDTPDKEFGASARTGNDKDFYTVRYKLKVADNAIKGWYNVTLSWNDGNTRKEADFPIYVDPKQADFVVGALATSPEKLKADMDGAKLSVSIDNIGDGRAENVKVKLLLPEGFRSTYSYSDEDSLGIIEKGQTKTADFYINIEEYVEAGEYIGQLQISYKNENDEGSHYLTDSIDLWIPVKPSPYLIVDSVSPQDLEAGRSDVLLFRVTNTGNEEIESVSLRVFKDASQPFEFSDKSDFIGKLEPGQSGEATLHLNVRDNAAIKKHLLDVELRGIDNSENVVIFRRTIPLTVQNNEQGFSAGIALGAAVLGIGAFGTLIFLRKGRSWHNDK